MILHLDMDSFFATVEQQANPFLRNRPIGITKQEGRSCVIAASVEAKRFGVKTGTSIWEAKKLCPEIIFVPSDMEKYFSVTKQLVEIVSSFSSLVEVFSIDEVFLDISQTQAFFGGPFFLALKIKQLINEKIGGWITASIGVSYNKLLAKLASEQNKPDGYFEINEKNRDKILGKINFYDICGIGWRLTPRLLNAGIRNLLQIREMPDDLLQATFGPYWSVELKRLAWGIDESPVVSATEMPEMKSVSRTFTLFKNTREEKEIKQTMRNLCEEAARKIRDMEMMTRQVGVGIRGDDQSIYGHKTLKHYLDDGQEIFDLVWRIYQKWHWPLSVRFIGVWLGLLEKREYLTQDLFPWKRRKSTLLKAMDQVNKRFGELTVYPARLLGGELIRSEVNGYLGDKKYRLG
jgi:DNA polymerase-4